MVIMKFARRAALAFRIGINSQIILPWLGVDYRLNGLRDANIRLSGPSALGGSVAELEGFGTTTAFDVNGMLIGECEILSLGTAVGTRSLSSGAAVDSGRSALASTTIVFPIRG